MTDAALAQRIIACDFMREIYQGCLATEQAKVTPRNARAPEFSPARVEARAWDQTKAVMLRMQERAA
jgi:hypothetical protein